MDEKRFAVAFHVLFFDVPKLKIVNFLSTWLHNRQCHIIIMWLYSVQVALCNLLPSFTYF